MVIMPRPKVLRKAAVWGQGETEEFQENMDKKFTIYKRMYTFKNFFN